MAGLAGLAVKRLLASHGFRMLLAQLGPAATAKAVELARQGRWRRLAILHAETLAEGRLSRAVFDGTVTWVVWQDDVPVAAYPPFEGDLADATRDHDPTARVAPDDLATRQAQRTASDSARDTGRRLGSGFAQARKIAGQGARRASEQGARRVGRSVGKRRGGVNPEGPPPEGGS